MTLQMLLKAVVIASIITLIKNYIALKISISKFWKMANPNMSKHEINQILRNLYEVKYTQDASSEATRMIEEHNEQIRQVIQNANRRILETLDMFNTTHIVYAEVFNEIVDLKLKSVEKVLEKHQEAISYINEAPEKVMKLWPEFFEESDDV